MTTRHELGDSPATLPRTTATLLASLAARTRTLGVISGSEALGSMIAGMAELGRQIATTAEGSRLRRGLADSRAVANGDALWDALGIAQALATLPPSPVYDDLRNDVSLLAAGDLGRRLADLSEAQMVESVGPVREPVHVDFLDFLLGMWAYARDLQAMIEGLAGRPAQDVIPPIDQTDLAGEVLR